jgi:DNA polymerase-3 subunit alpha
VIYVRKEVPELEQREKAEEEVAELLSLATRVEGMVRNIGMHAGGVLIAPGKITDFCPLYQQPGSDSAVSQFDKDDVEAIGLVKFDFLGLATLTILELAKEFIRRAARPGRTLPTRPFRWRTPRSTSCSQTADRGGVPVRKPRHAGHAARRQAQPAGRPDCAERPVPPGPDGPDPQLRGAQARPRRGDLPASHCWKPVLGETYGVMVYQEQVMQAAQVLGGYSLGGADLLRRAMGKKKAEEMAKHRGIFREGRGQGHPAEKADEVFDLMEKFAGYGFNKSHAAAYSLLAYHTAWIKVHCTAEFYAANMTIESDNTDKLKVLLNDAKLFRIGFEAARRQPGRAPLRAGQRPLVRYGLGAVKGTGQGAIEAIVAAREGQGATKAGRRALPQPVRLLRPGGPQGASTSGWWRRWSRPVPSTCCTPRAEGRAACWPAWAWPSSGPTRRQPTRCRAGLFDMGDTTWQQHPGAGTGACAALGRARPAGAGEGGAGLLLRATCSTPGRPRCALCQTPAAGRPGGQPRPADAGRHRHRPAHRSTASAARW